MAKFNLKEHIAKNKATFFGSLTEGQFSWMTQDTGQQIGSQDENKIPVYMFDDKGKYYYEKDYDGYGVFGGKDYYELLDQMNGGSGDRSKGIDLAFDKIQTSSPILYPALITRPGEFNYKTHDFTQEAKHDPNQSWYDASYEEEDEDEDYGGFGDMDKEEDYDYSDEEELDEGFQGQFYAPEYLEQKYGKEIASKITAEIDEMDENSYDRFTDMYSAEEVEDYISDIKDMMDLNEGEAAYEYEKGKEAGEKIEKKKMKVSELKAKIKEMVIAEINIDVDNEISEYDFLKEIEDMLNEAEEDEEVDAEAAADAGAEEEIDTTVDVTTSEVDPNVKSVQDALTQAQAAAQQLGDKKLMDQIGNTITFFTRSHVVEKPKGAVAEGEEMEEGYFGANNEVEELIDTLGYENMDEFFSDNPGVITAILDWAAGVPEFRRKMIDNGLLEAKKENMNESLQNDDLIYDRMLDIDQEQLVSSILSFAENNPSITLEDYLNNEFGYNDDVEENKTKDLNESMFPMLKKILK
jgi:hypothetical protein